MKAIQNNKINIPTTEMGKHTPHTAKKSKTISEQNKNNETNHKIYIYILVCIKIINKHKLWFCCDPVSFSKSPQKTIKMTYNHTIFKDRWLCG